MAKREPKKPETNAPAPAASPAAGPCPNHPGHTATKVYKVDGRVRHCKCNDCGATWKTTRPDELAADARDYLQTLADELESAPRDKAGDGRDVVVIEDAAVQSIVDRLRQITAA